MRKILISLLTLLAFAAARADAQQSASRRAAAMELLLAMRVPETLQASITTALQVQLQGNPQMRGMEPVLRDFFARYVSWDRLKDQYADLYASTFTEEELQQMTQFYRTPVGQKLARSSPLLLRQGAELGERAVRQHMPELQEMIRQQLLTRTRP